jgi:hypothetical protein
MIFSFGFKRVFLYEGGWEEWSAKVRIKLMDDTNIKRDFRYLLQLRYGIYWRFA